MFTVYVKRKESGEKKRGRKKRRKKKKRFIIKKERLFVNRFKFDFEYQVREMLKRVTKKNFSTCSTSNGFKLV